MPGLLYPSMQKFYSALSSLDKFSKENNFFENISSLDTFFSEYRNITFVLQKSLANTKYITIYEKLRDKYLSDCRWFVEKRNETTKQQPFRLVKKIELTIYFPDQSFKVTTKQFTVENDISIGTLIRQFEQLFTDINSFEVYFSAAFSFYENNSKFDIYNEIISGITKMECFLNEMKSEIKETCKLCEEIERAIIDFAVFSLPRDMFLVSDYVYYTQKCEFEKASRVAMTTAGHRETLHRMSLDGFCNGVFEGIGDTVFEKFVMMHVIIGNVDVMPTRMIVYNDHTFELDAFNSDIKTTLYRKINETAKIILNEDVKEVFWMHTYMLYPSTSEASTVPSNERYRFATKEFLTFIRVDNALNEEEIIFDGFFIECENYIVNQMRNSTGNRLELGKRNMIPILEAFKNKQKNLS